MVFLRKISCIVTSYYGTKLRSLKNFPAGRAGTGEGSSAENRRLMPSLVAVGEAQAVPPAKVLLLEDNPGLRQTIAKLMTKRGFEVHVAASGEQALQAAARDSFDLFITDLRMEGMSGLDTLEVIKRSQPRLASLVITGYDTEEDRARATALGVGDILTKPCKLPALMEAVSTVLARKAKARPEVGAKSKTTVKKLKPKPKPRGSEASPPPRPDPAEANLSGPPESQPAVESEAAQASEPAGLEQDRPPTAHPETPGPSREAPHSRGEDELCDSLLLLLEASLSRSVPPEAGQNSSRAALQIGLSESQARWTRAAVMARALVDSGRIRLASAPLPEALKQVVDSALDPWTSTSPQARIVAAVLELHPDVSDYDPEVLAALANSPDGEAGRPSVRLLNALLWTARALGEKGQVAGSRFALKTVLAHSKNLRQTVKSELSLSALERDHGQEEVATRHAQRALEVAGRRGPRASGQAHLQAAVIWGGHRDDLAQTWLERANELAAQVNDPLLASAAQLALVRFGFSNGGFWPHLKPLAHPQGAPERAEAVSWLLPGLLVSQETEVGPILESWAAEFPDVLAGLIESDQLQPEARQRAMELFERYGRQAATPRVLSFGEFQVYRGTTLCTGWKSQKVRYLLAYLMGCGGGRVSDETLHDRLWPELEPAAARESLGAACEILRAHIKECFGLETLLLRDSAGTGINPEMSVWHDLEELSKLAKRAAEMARKGQPEVEAILRRMLDLYRGPYLDGCFMSWALERRQQLERYARESATRLTDLYSRRGQPEQVVEIGARALELELCQESVAARVLRAFEKLERLEAAKEFYAEYLNLSGPPTSEELRAAVDAIGL